MKTQQGIFQVRLGTERLFALLIHTTALFFLLPILRFIAIAIRFDSPGDLYYFNYGWVKVGNQSKSKSFAQ